MISEEKRQINIRTTFLKPYHCVCCSGCSANVSLSSPEYLPFPTWIAVERRVLTWNRFSLLTCGGETRGWRYSHPAWRLRPQFPSADPDSCWFSPSVSSRWVVSSSVSGGKKIIAMVKQRGGGRRRRAEAWSKRVARSLCMYIHNYPTFLSSLALECLPELYAIYEAVMFPTGCLRSCVLFSGSQRAFRGLGAARPRYLSAAISMWMLQLFGCGIFPHTGSY